LPLTLVNGAWIKKMALATFPNGKMRLKPLYIICIPLAKANGNGLCFLKLLIHFLTFGQYSFFLDNLLYENYGEYLFKMNIRLLS